MPSAYLRALRALHEHYKTLGALAESGQWEQMSQAAASAPAIIAALDATPGPASADEKTEAKTLLASLLQIDQRVRLLASAWQKDVAPLLAVLNKA